MITFTCNPLQAVRLSVIYYNIPVIDYRVSVSINSKFQKPRERNFCSNATLKSLNFRTQFLSQFSTKSRPAKPKIHHFSFSFSSTDPLPHLSIKDTPIVSSLAHFFPFSSNILCFLLFFTVKLTTLCLFFGCMWLEFFGHFLPPLLMCLSL